MNPKSIFNLFSLKGIGQIPIPRQVFTFVISLAVLSLFALTACRQVPASAPVVEEALLVVAPAAVTEQEPAGDSISLDANPPAEVVAPQTEATTGSAFAAANPELAIAGRYADMAEKRAEATDLAGAYNTAALRYKFLHGLGTEAGIENEVSHSATFDKESLRQIYFQDWAIEANAADAVKPGTTSERTIDFWIAVLSRTYNRQAETPWLSPVIQPVTFDIEGLRQTYFQDWKIEADTAIEAIPSTTQAANPEFIEIMRIRRDAEAAEMRAEAAFLAANPELMVARRSAAMVEWNHLHHPGR